MKSEIGFHCDSLDQSAKWFTSKVVDVDEKESKVKIHYDGFSDRRDEWIDLYV